MNKEEFIKNKIEKLEFQKDEINKSVDLCISYNPDIIFKKLDDEIHKWKNLSNEEYDDIFKKQLEIEKQKQIEIEEQKQIEIDIKNICDKLEITLEDYDILSIEDIKLKINNL